MSTDNNTYTVNPICLEVERSEEIVLEVGLRDDEIIVVIRQNEYNPALILNLKTYRRLVLLQSNVEHCAEIIDYFRAHNMDDS